VLNQPQDSDEVAGNVEITGGGSGSLTGALSGSTLTFAGKGENEYTAKGVETISEDQLSWTGTYEDNEGTKGTLTATRPSLPSFPAPTAPGAPAAQLRVSAIQVLCNYEVAFSNFTCTAQVGDASGASPAKIPTGTVSFTAPSGGFSPTSQRALVATPSSPNTASCSVTYTPASKIPVGTPAPVTGAYGGESTFAPTAAKSGTGAVISPIVKAATLTGEGAKTTVSCPAGAASCPIVVSLSVLESEGGAVAASKKAKRPKRKKITIGNTKLTLVAGQQRAVSVSLNAAGRRLLAKHKRLTALLTVTTGGTVVKTQKIQIKLKRG
jgi:hypothetical protein